MFLSIPIWFTAESPYKIYNQVNGVPYFAYAFISDGLAMFIFFSESSSFKHLINPQTISNDF